MKNSLERNSGLILQDKTSARFLVLVNTIKDKFDPTVTFLSLESLSSRILILNESPCIVSGSCRSTR